MEESERTHDDEQERQDILKLSTLTIIILIILSLLYSGCYYKCQEYTYTTYQAEYLKLDSLKDQVSFGDPREINLPGGIYYKQGFVFINERGKGIHIIDDTNPSNPESVGFLTIPGNFAMAAKGDYLYADNYTDLLVFDISDLTEPQLVMRQENVFSNFQSIDAYYDESTNSLVVYNPVEVTDEDCGEGRSYWFGGKAYSDDVVLAEAYYDVGGGSENGEAGSMARFVVDGETLYTVDFSSLRVFDATSPEAPMIEGAVDLGWGIETIFPYKNMLFIGAMDGMYIMDNSDKLNPVQLAKYEHTTSCDPVVVQGDYAYVTLRNGTECQGFTNQLDIVNISDPSNPTLAKTYEMMHPHGLDINSECLFVCEGEHGLKAFNVDLNNPTSITQTAFHQDVDAFDVISLPNILLMVGKDGFYQYDYNCGQSLYFLSSIAFGADQ